MDSSDLKDLSQAPPAHTYIDLETYSKPKKDTEQEIRDPLSELIYDVRTSTCVLAVAVAEQSSKGSFFTIEFYQQFFNVDSFMVAERVLNSLIPKRAEGNYLRSSIEQNPDLYGPIWITITLIFCIAINGNIANYMQHDSESYYWRYNFRLVSYAATCIFIYAFIFPIALWTLLKYSLKAVTKGLEAEGLLFTPSLLSLMCIYGYSLAIYVPFSILWVIQDSLFQWYTVIIAASLSGIALILILMPALRNSTMSRLLFVGILAAHFVFGAGFMVLFF